jgi:hypothetical protein
MPDYASDESDLDPDFDSSKDPESADINDTPTIPLLTNHLLKMRSPTTTPLSSRPRRRLLSPRLDPLVLVNWYSVSKPPILLALPDYKRLPRSLEH